MGTLDAKRLASRCERAARLLQLTPDEVKIMQREAWALYEEISYDLEPDIKRRGTCKRSTILEVVLDAGRLEQRLMRPVSGKESPRITPGIAKAFREDDGGDLLSDLIGPAFPSREYEVGASNEFL